MYRLICYNIYLEKAAFEDAEHKGLTQICI